MAFLGSKNDLPESVLRKTEAWTRCVSGAMEREEYEKILKRAGSEDVSVEVTNVYDPEAVERLSGPEEVEALRRVPPPARLYAPANPPGSPRTAGTGVARADGLGVLRENGVRRDGGRSELSEDGVVGRPGLLPLAQPPAGPPRAVTELPMGRWRHAMPVCRTNSIPSIGRLPSNRLRPGLRNRRALGGMSASARSHGPSATAIVPVNRCAVPGGAAEGDLDRAALPVAARRATLAVAGFERDHAAAAVDLDLATAQEHRPQPGAPALHPGLRARE